MYYPWYLLLSNLSFRKLALDFMSSRNNTQSGTTHTAMNHLLSVTEEQGLNRPFKHIQDPKSCHSCQCRDNCLGDGTQTVQSHLFLPDASLQHLIEQQADGLESCPLSSAGNWRAPSPPPVNTQHTRRYSGLPRMLPQTPTLGKGFCKSDGLSGVLRTSMNQSIFQ